MPGTVPVIEIWQTPWDYWRPDFRLHFARFDFSRKFCIIALPR